MARRSSLHLLLFAALLVSGGCSSLRPSGYVDASTEAGAEGDDGGNDGAPEGGPPPDAAAEGDAGKVTDGSADVAEDASDADTALDSASDATIGAGPLGALPSGYCCASDDDCRFRHCELVNGTKMCLDFCLSDDDCRGIATDFHCGFTDAGYGHCEPSPSITTCASRAQYVHGTKPLGACCQQLSDGRMGTECLSGLCGQNGSENPFVCVQNCGDVDCPLTWTCGWGDDYGTRHQCWPVKFNYTCTP